MNPITSHVPRRRFLQGIALGAPALAAARDDGQPATEPAAATPRPEYSGPKVVLVRFGGGVRRRETIDPDHTYAPWTRKEFAKQGTLFTNMMIDPALELNTSHGEGTLNILTGVYRKYQDVGKTNPAVEEQFLGSRFEADAPTLFEYLRAAFQVPEHQTLIVNGEDRAQEEFYSFSNHHLFGAQFKSEVLSLFRFKFMAPTSSSSPDGALDAERPKPASPRRSELEQMRANSTTGCRRGDFSRQPRDRRLLASAGASPLR